MPHHSKGRTPLCAALTNRESFRVTLEICGGSSVVAPRHCRTPRQLAELANNEKRLTAVAFGDNFGTFSAMAEFSDAFNRYGVESILYYSLRGRSCSRIAWEFQLLHEVGLQNVLIVSGDYPPVDGNPSAQNAQFDLDSVQALMLVNGRGETICREEQWPIPPAAFCSGCVVSPFKALREERLGQYVKLVRKVRAGTQFVVTQIGYDMERLAELRQFCRDQQLEVPVLVNLFLPGPELARKMMNGKIPGVCLSWEEARALGAGEQSTGSETETILQTAARRIAIIRGLGFSGVHLGGPGLRQEDIPRLLDQAEEYAPFWEEHYAEFVSKRQPGAGWGARISEDLCSAARPGPVRHMRFRYPLYSLSWLIDWAVFAPRGQLYRIMKRLCRHADGNGWLAAVLYLVEQGSKFVLYGCRMCGDCTLYSSSFICMASTCPKKQLNGPCGGSIKGYCEVYPGRRLCRWVLAYQQCPDDSLETLCREPSLPPKDRRLQKTSSWINFFTGRDHRQIGGRQD